MVKENKEYMDQGVMLFKKIITYMYEIQEMEQLIDTFIDCPYITRDEFADVMEEVIEVFYTMKNECSDLIDDQHLMHYMRKQLDECHGVIVMMSDAVNEYCRKTVEKGIYEPAE